MPETGSGVSGGIKRGDRKDKSDSTKGAKSGQGGVEKVEWGQMRSTEGLVGPDSA